jgi:hypothetical protein
MSNKQHDTHVPHQHAPKAAWHKDWRTWVVVGLMVVAMAVYILSLDESEGPAARQTGTQEPISAE